MASRQADQEAIVERCRRAGWQIEQVNDGWRVYDSSGGSHNVHLTPSDRNAQQVLMRRLTKAGLIADETAIRSARLDEKRTAAQVAAEAAERRAKEMANNASVARAAGPYYTQPEQVDLGWFTTPHPAPWMRWVQITPYIARHLLDHHNCNNRPIDDNAADYYRNIILIGKWHLTHQGLAIDTAGILQDGQHRLEAVCRAAEADATFEGVPFAVFVGMPEENFKAIDEGKLRTAAQLFGRDGQKNTATLQSLVRLVHYLNDPDARRSARLRLPNEIIIDEYEADAERFTACAAFGQANTVKLHMGPGPLGAARYLLHKVNGWDNQYVDDFFFGLIKQRHPGENRRALADYDPRRVLLNRMAALKEARLRGQKEQRRNGLSQVGMILYSWNNCVKGHSPRVLMFTDMSTIPEVLKCVPGEGATPEAFRGR